MTPEFITGFFFDAIKTAISLAAPMLLAGLAVGLLVSMFQAATSINEMTLTFIPKNACRGCGPDFFLSLDDANHDRFYSESARKLNALCSLIRMVSLNISLPQLQLFFLVFLRVGAILMSIPIFDSRGIPFFFKIALAFATGIVLFPLLKLDVVPVASNLFALSINVAGEILLGLAIGFSVKLIFAGIQLAGQLAGYQMGLAIANVMDPATSEQVPLLAQFNNLMGLLVFLSINAHYWFIKALTESFRLVPPLNVNFGSSLLEQLIRLSGNMFVIALQVGAPVIAAMLLTSVAFGLIARTVPQMNVFIVAMPLKIGVGLLFIGFGLPYFAAFLESIFNDLGQNIILMIKTMS